MRWVILPGHYLSLSSGFKIGNTCDRNACSDSVSYCSRQLAGVYRYLGPACDTNSTCTDCSITTEGATECVCQKAPYTLGALHGQSCGLNTKCVDGSECFRPCNTYLFQFDCPTDRCMWSTAWGSCQDLVTEPSLPTWSTMVAGTTNISLIADTIVSGTPAEYFPIPYSDLQGAVWDFEYNGQYLISVVSMDTLFQLLDTNTDAMISQEEFSSLGSILASIFISNPPSSRRLSSLVPPLTGSDVAKCLSLTSDSPPSLVSACASPDLQGSICAADGGKYYCSLDQTCKSDCVSSCDWLNTEDPSTNRCIPATVSACKAISKQYCGSSRKCVAYCDTECSSFPVSDSVTSTCRSVWWEKQPSSNPANWVCAYRHSADQRCVTDIDCIFGQRKCSQDGLCLPATASCTSDRDCGISFYCPSDPTGGQDPFFEKKCKLQQTDGGDCNVHSDCHGLLRCNSQDPSKIQGFNGKCRGLFSLPTGSASSESALCESGQLDISGSACAVPFKGKRTAYACTSDTDCGTTDPSGSFAHCACIGWWDRDDVACKRCQAVVGDLANSGESLRNWLYVRGSYCSSVWTDEECLREKKDEVASSYYSYMCELQTRSGGVSVLGSDSACTDDSGLVIDYCALGSR
jgi:hypothetical protein